MTTAGIDRMFSTFQAALALANFALWIGFGLAMHLGVGMIAVIFAMRPYMRRLGA